jgi:hypothetical protein
MIDFLIPNAMAADAGASGPVPGLDILIIVVIVGIIWLIVSKTKRPTEPKLLGCFSANCNFRDEVTPILKGNRFIAFLLILAGIVPGILYITMYMKTKFICPSCGVLIRED